MSERLTPRDFPDPRDIHGRLVRVETKLDLMKDTVESIDEKVIVITSSLDTSRGAAGVAQRIGVVVMAVFASICGAIAGAIITWLRH